MKNSANYPAYKGGRYHYAIPAIRGFSGPLLLLKQTKKQPGKYPVVIKLSWQKRLRHTDIRTTGNIYSHVTKNMQEGADKKMSKILNLPKERQKERQKKNWQG